MIEKKGCGPLTIDLQENTTDSRREQTCDCKGVRGGRTGEAGTGRCNLLYVGWIITGPTVQHRELCSIPCNKQYGKEKKRKMQR